MAVFISSAEQCGLQKCAELRGVFRVGHWAMPPFAGTTNFFGTNVSSVLEVSLLLDPEYGMLYLQNYDTTSALAFLGAN